MLDVIKEYLVGLGFKVDTSSYNHMMDSMEHLDDSVKGFGTTATSSFATATTAVISFVAAANVGVLKFLESLAKADLENEKFAKKMWMNADSARAMNSSLKAMDATLEDLYYSQEQLQNFMKLRDQARSMEAPDEVKGMYRFIRSITFEFQRLKLEVTYALQWVGYYLMKYLEGPLEKFKFSLKNLNDNLVKTMPSWTKEIAQVISWFVRLGDAAVWGFGKILKLLDSVPDGVKKAGVAFAGLSLILKTGPIGAMITALSSLLLLLDDYKTYKTGGQSLFEGAWKSVDRFFAELQDSGKIDEFKQKLSDLVEFGRNVFETLKSSVVSMYKVFEENGAIAAIKDTFGNALSIISGSIRVTGGVVVELFKQLSSSPAVKKFTDQVTDLFTNVFKLLDAFTKVLDSIINMDDQGGQGIKNLASVINTVLTPAVKLLGDALEVVNGTMKAITSIMNGTFIDDAGNWIKQTWGWGENNSSSPTGLSNGTLPGYSIPGGSGVMNSGAIKFSPTYNVFTNQNPVAVGQSITQHSTDMAIRVFGGVKK